MGTIRRKNKTHMRAVVKKLEVIFKKSNPWISWIQEMGKKVAPSKHKIRKDSQTILEQRMMTEEKCFFVRQGDYV